MTKRIRICIVIGSRVDGTLRRLAAATHIPKATLARMFLIEAEPVMAEMAAVFESGHIENARPRFEALAKRLQGEIDELPLPEEKTE